MERAQTLRASISLLFGYSLFSSLIPTSEILQRPCFNWVFTSSQARCSKQNRDVREIIHLPRADSQDLSVSYSLLGCGQPRRIISL